MKNSDLCNSLLEQFTERQQALYKKQRFLLEHGFNLEAEAVKYGTDAWSEAKSLIWILMSNNGIK